MTKEEKEAIEWLKRLVKLNKRDNLDDTFAEILLNLIEKQSKEIEEIKQEKEYLNCIIESDEDNYINKDKIKEKIEECENKIKKIRNKKLINEPEDTIVITRYSHYISVLQSLLEKE